MEQDFFLEIPAFLAIECGISRAEKLQSIVTLLSIVVVCFCFNLNFLALQVLHMKFKKAQISK